MTEITGIGNIRLKSANLPPACEQEVREVISSMDAKQGEVLVEYESINLPIDPPIAGISQVSLLHHFRCSQPQC